MLAYQVKGQMDLSFEFGLGQFVGGALVDVALRLHLRVVGQPVHLKRTNR